MNAVRQALARTGHRLAYSRERGGYYIEGRPALDERLLRLIAGAAAEVDPRQIAIYRQLSPAQRIWQLAHLSDWLRQANERREQRSRRDKLHYFRLSQQPKHVRDITSILLAVSDELDMAYITTWAHRLGLTTLWAEVQRQAQARAS